MGVEIKVDDLTKSFGKQLIWGDVTLTIPAGEICVMLGPSGTGKSVFLKTLIGLLKPDKGSIFIEGTDIATCPEKELYEIRKLFGVLFQDGAMFGPREMLLSSEEPVVRQFLNAQRVGPIGMSEEKDADELASEEGQELPPLPPIPYQQEPSNGIPRRSQREPGAWCKENGVTPPPGSFEKNMNMTVGG